MHDTIFKLNPTKVLFLKISSGTATEIAHSQCFLILLRLIVGATLSERPTMNGYFGRATGDIFGLVALWLHASACN